MLYVKPGASVLSSRFWAPNVAKERDDAGYNQVQSREQRHESWEDDNQDTKENHKRSRDLEGNAHPPEDPPSSLEIGPSLTRVTPQCHHAS